MRTQRACLHVHSCFSNESVYFKNKPLLGADPLHPVGTPEQIYSILKKGGMTIFTLTDHDTLEGAKYFKEVIPEKNFVYGCEIKTVIDEDTVKKWGHGLVKGKTKMDVGVYADEPTYIEEAIDRRSNFHEFIEYVKKQRELDNIHMYQLMHPAWSPNKGYVPLIFTLNVMRNFQVVEARNGHHPIGEYSMETIARMFGKGVTSGSDAHYYKNAATNWTEVQAKDVKSFFRQIEQKQSKLFGRNGHPIGWVQEGYHMAWQDLKHNIPRLYNPTKTARSIMAVAAMVGLIPVGCYSYSIFSKAKIRLRKSKDKRILHACMPTVF